MFDEDERPIYETRMQALADVESKIASAEEKGLEKGREEGIEKGRDEAAHAIAGNLLKLGLDHETIEQATSLSVSVIAALAEVGEYSGFP